MEMKKVISAAEVINTAEIVAGTDRTATIRLQTGDVFITAPFCDWELKKNGGFYIETLHSIYRR